MDDWHGSSSSDGDTSTLNQAGALAAAHEGRSVPVGVPNESASSSAASDHDDDFRPDDTARMDDWHGSSSSDGDGGESGTERPSTSEEETSTLNQAGALAAAHEGRSVP